MKRYANPATRLAFGLSGLCVFACMGMVHAQTSDPTSAAASTPAAASSAAAPVYQDHYIAGGSLAPDFSFGDGVTTDTEGLFRALQIDAVASVLSSDGGGFSQSTQENGLIVKSQWDTAAYGAWSLDGAARTGSSGETVGG